MATRLTVHKFWTQYEPSPDDAAKLKGVDWVAYGPFGQEDRSITIDKVNRLLGQLQPREGSANIAVIAAHERANFIKQHYDAWKSGQEAPTHGTPLAAWNAISPEQADVLKARNIRTVEDIALMSDHQLTRVPLPNMRDLQTQARAFVDAADQTRFAKMLEDKNSEILALKAENRDRDGLIAELTKKVDQLASLVVQAQEIQSSDAEPAKRGPGRPRKDVAEAAA